MFETQKILSENYKKLDNNEKRPSLAESLLRVTPLTKSQEKLEGNKYDINLIQKPNKGPGFMHKIKQYAVNSGNDLHVLTG